MLTDDQIVEMATRDALKRPPAEVAASYGTDALKLHALVLEGKTHSDGSPVFDAGDVRMYARVAARFARMALEGGAL